MAEGQKKNLYLYGALLCFIGIIAVFFVDGYLGVYDTVYIKTMEQEQKIEFETGRECKPYVTVRWDESVRFRYEIDNRSFFTYSVPVEVSLWHGEKKVTELLHENISVAPFDKETLVWILDTTRLEQPVGRNIHYTLKINRGATEREFIVVLTPIGEYSLPPPAPVPIK